MSNLETGRQEAIRAIDSASETLVDLARFIHANPELGMEEVRAAARCVDLLRQYGFRVEADVAGLPTAFVGVQGEGHPTVGILVEYDALPVVGHGCGHNLMAGATIGAGIGAAAALARTGGSVYVFGTPGEEGQGGKVYMIRDGLFDDMDIVIGTHPHPVYATVGTIPGSGKTLAAQSVVVEFYGKPAHAARDPFNGVNALNAVIETFNGINALRQHIRPSARIHGIIRHGGDAVNVIPEYAKAEFLIRSETRDERDDLMGKIHAIAQGAALITGARLDWQPSTAPYDEMIPNYTIAQRIKTNFDSVGLITAPPVAGPGLASSDIGNVSYVVPTGAGSFPIIDKAIPWHSQQAAEASGSEQGYAAMVKAAKGLALTMLDFLLDPDLVEAACDEHIATLKAHDN